MANKKRMVLAIGAVLGLLTLFITLDYFGFVWHNDLLAAKYQVKGLDVSHHQKQIDWKKVFETQKYKFVFIKATEGHDFVDDDFARNWKEAKENGLMVGAYHFFSTRSSGKAQADEFMKVVPLEAAALPPVIDIEISLSKDVEATQKELTDLIQQLENHYHKRPILYVTYDTYGTYVESEFQGYPVWIRDIVRSPQLQEQEWAIWQYSNRGRVPGITTYVDLNVFRGSIEELAELARPINK